jgi:type II secretory pathway component PulC
MPTTNEIRTEQPMYVRLPVELHDAVKQRSAVDERTMAQTIRVALRYYLKTTEPIAAP